MIPYTCRNFALFHENAEMQEKQDKRNAKNVAMQTYNDVKIVYRLCKDLVFSHVLILQASMLGAFLAFEQML